MICSIPKYISLTRMHFMIFFNRLFHLLSRSTIERIEWMNEFKYHCFSCFLLRFLQITLSIFTDRFTITVDFKTVKQDISFQLCANTDISKIFGWISGNECACWNVIFWLYFISLPKVLIDEYNILTWIIIRFGSVMHISVGTTNHNRAITKSRAEKF